MSVEKAIEEFRSAAIEKGDYAEVADRDHELHATMARAWIELESCGEAGRSAFKLLLANDSEYVRIWVASQLLADGDESGVPVLEELVAGGGALGFDAEIVLKEWRAGRLQPPFTEEGA